MYERRHVEPKNSIKMYEVYEKKKKRMFMMVERHERVYIAKGKNDLKICSSVFRMYCFGEALSCLKLITKAAFTRGTCIQHWNYGGRFDSVMLIITIEKWIY